MVYCFLNMEQVFKKTKTSYLAIASFIFGLYVFVFLIVGFFKVEFYLLSILFGALAIILGIIGLFRIKKFGLSNKKLAVIGVTLGIIGILLAIIFLGSGFFIQF